MQIVAGGDRPTRTIDADHDRLHLVVMGGFLDLLLSVARQAFEQNTIDANECNPVMSELLTRVMAVAKRSLVVRQRECQNQDERIKRNRSPKRQVESPAEHPAPKRRAR